MKTKIYNTGLVVFVILVCGSSLTLGQEKVAFTLDLSGDVDIFDSSQAQGYVLGWTFYVPGPSSIWITQVGVLDAGGDGYLKSAHKVGIWGPDPEKPYEPAVLLATADVPTAENFDGFFYVTLDSPLELTPNPGAVENPPTQWAYTIGVLFSQGNQDDYLIRINDVPIEFDNSGLFLPWSSVTKPGEYSRDLDSDVLDRPSVGPYNDQRGFNVNFKFKTDIVPPVITCPGDVTIEAMGPDGVPVDDDRIQTFLAGASAIDDTDPDPVITNDAPAVFPVGDTVVTFTATDASGNYDTCTSTVTVVEAAESQLRIVPRIINRDGWLQKILAVVRFPEGYTEDDIDMDVPLVLYPDYGPYEIEATCQKIVTWQRWGTLRVSMFGFFPKEDVMNAVPEDGWVEFMVVGRFTDGQYFYGIRTVKIISWDW